MSEQESRIPKKIPISEEEARKWDQFNLIARPDPSKPFIFEPSQWKRLHGRFTVTFAGGRENWHSLHDIQKGDVVVIERPGRTDKNLECLKIDGNEIEFQDLWWEKRKGKGRQDREVSTE